MNETHIPADEASTKASPHLFSEIFNNLIQLISWCTNSVSLEAVCSIVLISVVPVYLLWNYYYQRKSILLPKFKNMLNIEDLSKDSEIPFEVESGQGKAKFLLKHLDVRKNLLGLTLKSQIQKIRIKLIPQDRISATIFVNLSKDLREESVDISSNTWYMVRLQIQEKGSFIWSSWSAEDLFLADKEIPFSIDTFRPTAEDFTKIREQLGKLESPYNVLVIGKIGNGKSSLLNSLFAAVKNAYKVVALSSSSNSSFTTRMNVHELINQKVTFYDLPGWESDFRFELIPEIIKGRCEGITRDEMRNGMFDFGTPGGPAKIDVVIFVIAANSYQDDEVIHEKIRRQLEIAQVRCIFVVTKLDLGGRDDILNTVKAENYLNSSAVIQKVKDIKKYYNDNIYPIINIQNSKCKEGQVGYMALTILKAALNIT